MRRLVRDNDSRILEVVHTHDSTHSSVISNEDAQALVDSGDGIIYDTIEKLNEALAYAESRREAYPPIQEQLDLLYHEIIVSGSLTSSGSWAQSIKTVKDANPKP